jgi:acylglycerol lipase
VWEPEGNPRAAVVIVHGLGDHCGRYGNLVNHLVPLGYAVYGLDHIGHGASEGKRTYIERFTDFTETLDRYVRMVKGWQPDIPLFLLGHSLGGLIATVYLLEHQDEFRGAVLSAPAVKVGESIPRAAIAATRILSALAPRLGVSALDARTVSSDPLVVRAYLEDPLVFHGKTPARTGAEALKAIARVSAEAHVLTLPLLIMQGGADRLSDPNGARMLFDAVASPDKTLRIYPGLHHEVFNEPEREQVLGDVASWLGARIAPVDGPESARHPAAAAK